MGMAKHPGDGKCYNMFHRGPCNYDEWFVLSPKDPEEIEGHCQLNPCGTNKVKMNGTCRGIGLFDGCEGAPMAVHVDMYGQPSCQCPCSCLYNCTDWYHPLWFRFQLATTSYCPDPDNPTFVFSEPPCFWRYNRIFARQETRFASPDSRPDLVNFMPTRACGQGQVLAKNGRCYKRDEVMLRRSPLNRKLTDYEQYVHQNTRFMENKAVLE